MGKKIKYSHQLLSINRRIKRYDDPCSECGTMENRTRHHVKNWDGMRTGKIVILCRSCHDEIEKKYSNQGRLSRSKHIKLTAIENADTIRLRPFYSIYPRFDDIRRGDGF